MLVYVYQETNFLRCLQKGCQFPQYLNRVYNEAVCVLLAQGLLRLARDLAS